MMVTNNIGEIIRLLELADPCNLLVTVPLEVIYFSRLVFITYRYRKVQILR